MLKHLTFIMAAAMVLSFGGIAQATPVTVGNYSFELPVGTMEFPSLLQQGGSGWSWQSDGNWGGYTDAGVTTERGGSDGSQAGILSSADSGNAYAWQVTNYMIQAGDEITLTVDLRAYYADSPLSPTYYYSLVASDTAVNPANPLTDIATGTITSALGGSWAEYTLTYTATAADAGKYLGIQFHGVHTGGYGYLFDNVRLDVTSIPEPATMALLGFGGVGLLIRRKRK